MQARDLNYQESLELKERAERIKRLANEYGQYDFLHEGDKAVYHVDFKTRKLVSKEVISEPKDLNHILGLRLDFWFRMNQKQQRQLSSIGYSHTACEEVTLFDLKQVTKSKKIIQAWQSLQDALR